MANYLLHIDTSTDTGTVAIGSNGNLLAYRTTNEARNHAIAINSMIADVLSETDLSFKHLNAIVVCGGPGSYTGLRIGMATAKGLCYAQDKPMLLDDRLTLLAYKAYREHGNTFSQYVSLLRARDKEYFIGIYDTDFTCTLPPQHIAQEDLESLTWKKENSYIISDAPDIINNFSINRIKIDTGTQTDLKSWIFYAFERYNCNNIVNLTNAEPFYLKQVYTHK